MKKIIIAFSLLISATCSFAQTGWETPTNVSNGQGQEKKALFGNKTAKVIEPKYQKGAVTEENGKVCWVKTFELPGLSASQVYDKTLAAMQKFVKTDKQSEKSAVAVVNKDSKKIGVRLNEKLVFANKALSYDFTEFNYHLLIACSDGKCTVRMTNLSYFYEAGRPSEARYSAEEMISDSVSFNKKGTKYTKGGTKKFREKTIDRKDKVFAWIETELK